MIPLIQELTNEGKQKKLGMKWFTWWTFGLPTFNILNFLLQLYVASDSTWNGTTYTWFICYFGVLAFSFVRGYYIVKKKKQWFDIFTIASAVEVTLLICMSLLSIGTTGDDEVAVDIIWDIAMYALTYFYFKKRIDCVKVVDSHSKNKGNKTNKKTIVNDEEYDDEDESTEDEFKCSNCGTTIKENATKCPKCGESFDDEVEEVEEKPKKKEKVKAKSNMDQKYDDLLKLKKLLDKDIITKEEFEKEKKDILNS